MIPDRGDDRGRGSAAAGSAVQPDALAGLRSGMLLLTMSAAKMLFVVNAPRFEYTGGTGAEMLSLRSPRPGREAAWWRKARAPPVLTQSSCWIHVPYTSCSVDEPAQHRTGGPRDVFGGRCRTVTSLCPVSCCQEEFVDLLGLLAAFWTLSRRGSARSVAFALALSRGLLRWSRCAVYNSGSTRAADDAVWRCSARRRGARLRRGGRADRTGRQRPRPATLRDTCLPTTAATST